MVVVLVDIVVVTTTSVGGVTIGIRNHQDLV
jgi:hypothetical protein